MTLTGCITLLSGCASTLSLTENSDFGCEGMPDYKTCMSSMQVYEAVKNAELPDDPMQPILQPNENGVITSKSKPAALAGVHGEGEAAGKTAYTHPYKVPVPVRKPPSVMRIWIASWTDANDVLHWEQRIFTEVDEKKWNYAVEDFTASRAITRLPSTNTETQAPAHSPATTAGDGSNNEEMDTQGGSVMPF